MQVSDDAMREAYRSIDEQSPRAIEIAALLGFTLDEVKRRAWFKNLVAQDITKTSGESARMQHAT